MINYTLRQLECAVAAAELGSIAMAAERLGMAQPSTSAAIKKLEEQVGLQIFIRRHAQGVVPSAAGARFLAQARDILARATDLQNGTAQDPNLIAGDVHLGCFLTLAPAFGPQLIKGFTTANALATVTLQEGTQDTLLTGLREGRHDVALLYNVDLPQDIRAIDVMRLAPHIVLPAKHRLARADAIRLADLADDPFVLLDILPSRTYFLRVRAMGGITSAPAHVSASLELVRSMVAQGMGYSILITRPFGDRSYDGGKVVIKPIADDVELGIVSIARLRNVRMTRSVSAFEDFCVSYFKAMEQKI